MIQKILEEHWSNIYSNIVEMTRRNIGGISGRINDTKNMRGIL